MLLLTGKPWQKLVLLELNIYCGKLTVQKDVRTKLLEVNEIICPYLLKHYQEKACIVMLNNRSHIHLGLRTSPCFGTASMTERQELYRIRQEPDEPYQDFISHHLQVVCGLMVDGEAGVISVKQLVYEDVNVTFQTALCPLRKKGDTNDSQQPLCWHWAFKG